MKGGEILSKNYETQRSGKENTEQRGTVEKPSFTTRPPSKDSEPPKKKN
jgi:hypothetical protein